MPVFDNAQLGFLTKEQAKELLAILEVKKSPLAYRLTVLLLYSGARFSEVTGLTWNDIDFENRLFYFKATKNGNSRKVYILDVAMKVLKELYEEKSNNLVIPSRDGKQILQMPRQLQEDVDELIPDNDKAEDYRITPHSFRHTHASWMAIEGTDILDIKEQLGHKKLEMTMRYSHLIPDKRHKKTRTVFDSL